MWPTILRLFAKKNKEATETQKKMDVDQAFYDLIIKFEGFVSCPYRDQIGIPTIGIGTIVYPDGKRVTMKDTCISLEKAKEYMKSHLSYIIELVNKELPNLNQNQFNAVVSLIYNIGTGNFQKSTLLKKAKKNPNDPTLAYEFSRWVKAGGKVLPALVKRRKKEAELYFS